MIRRNYLKSFDDLHPDVPSSWEGIGTAESNCQCCECLFEAGVQYNRKPDILQVFLQSDIIDHRKGTRRQEEWRSCNSCTRCSLERTQLEILCGFTEIYRCF